MRSGSGGGAPHDSSVLHVVLERMLWLSQVRGREGRVVLVTNASLSIQTFLKSPKNLGAPEAEEIDDFCNRARLGWAPIINIITAHQSKLTDRENRKLMKPLNFWPRNTNGKTIVVFTLEFFIIARMCLS